MKIAIPDYVNKILNTLQENGFEGYVVGGAVRDSIMGKTATDWDITSNAKPYDIQKIFKKHFDTGLKHGTVTVLSDGKACEITTFRIDGEYEDNRKPKNVLFTDSLTEDLSRRDFTVNAIAYNENVGIVDPFGGVSDIKLKIIRAVGNPDKRFNEDALRMLRAIRFAAKLDFNIESETYSSIQKNAYLLKNISAERINAELTGFLLAGIRYELLYDSGICDVVLPELSLCYKTEQNNQHHIFNVGAHTIKALYEVESDAVLKYAVLLHDIGKPKAKTSKNNIDRFYGHAAFSTDLAKQILNRLKFDNKTKHDVLTLIELHDRQIKPDEKSVKLVMQKLSGVDFLKLLQIKKADALAQNPDFLSQKLKNLKDLEEIYLKINNENQPIKTKDLAVNGHDLIKLGYSGKKIGEILNALLDNVLENPALNNKQALINLIENDEKAKS